MIALWLGCAEDPEQVFARAKDQRDVEVLGKLCDEGRVEACGLAADAAPEGEARRPGWDEKACDAGALASCLRRSSDPGDRFRAAACKLGDRASCLPAGDAARARGDRAVAAELYGVRCAADPQDTACVLAKRMTEPPPAALPTGSPDEITAALWARCDADDGPACLELSEHVLGGGPLPPDPRKAAKSPWDPPTAVAWLRGQACDLQVTYACAFHRW